MKLFPFLFVIVATFLSACDEKKNNTTAAPGLKDTISIAYGAEVMLATEKLSLKFSDIQESRCPTNVNCIRAGEAIATMLVSTERNQNQQVKMEAKGMCEDTTGKCGETLKVSGYNIQLIDITPYPGTGTQTEGKARYTIRVVVTNGQS